ncbi:MAG: hypothetical protein ACKV2T_32225 [Kofleriaceae bacterium]
MNEAAELLVHDGESEGPLWRKTLDDEIVGVGADEKHVTAITATGTVATFSARTGSDMQSATLGEETRFAVVGTGARRVVAALANKVVALEGNIPRTIADGTASAIAISSDDTVLVAVVNALVVVAPDGSKTSTEHSLGPVVAAARHPEGFWMIATAKKVYRWSGGGEPTHVTSLPAEVTLKYIAATRHAFAIAYKTSGEGDGVATLDWPSKDTLASADYPEREVRGLSFGPWPWIAIALDLGDANKQNVLEPQRLHRSDTHPGRQHHSWLVAIGGAGAAAASATKSKAPASKNAAAPVPSPPYTPDPAPPSESPWRWIGLIAVVILLILGWTMRN